MGIIKSSAKIMFKTRKKREHMEIKEILHKAPSKRLFSNGIHSLLRRGDARRSVDIIYSIWCISL